MVSERLTEEDFAKRLIEVLERARAGERFHIEREGKVFAEVAPPKVDFSTTKDESSAHRPRRHDHSADDPDEKQAGRESLPENE